MNIGTDRPFLTNRAAFTGYSPEYALRLNIREGIRILEEAVAKRDEEGSFTLGDFAAGVLSEVHLQINRRPETSRRAWHGADRPRARGRAELPRSNSAWGLYLGIPGADGAPQQRGGGFRILEER
jgi:hypothetical protein